VETVVSNDDDDDDDDVVASVGPVRSHPGAGLCVWWRAAGVCQASDSAGRWVLRVTAALSTTSHHSTTGTRCRRHRLRTLPNLRSVGPCVSQVTG